MPTPCARKPIIISQHSPMNTSAFMRQGGGRGDDGGGRGGRGDGSAKGEYKRPEAGQPRRIWWAFGY